MHLQRRREGLALIRPDITLHRKGRLGYLDVYATCFPCDIRRQGSKMIPLRCKAITCETLSYSACLAVVRQNQFFGAQAFAQYVSEPKVFQCSGRNRVGGSARRRSAAAVKQSSMQLRLAAWRRPLSMTRHLILHIPSEVSLPANMCSSTDSDIHYQTNL